MFHLLFPSTHFCMQVSCWVAVGVTVAVSHKSIRDWRSLQAQLNYGLHAYSTSGKHGWWCFGLLYLFPIWIPSAVRPLTSDSTGETCFSGSLWLYKTKHMDSGRIDFFKMTCLLRVFFFIQWWLLVEADFMGFCAAGDPSFSLCNHINDFIFIFFYWRKIKGTKKSSHTLKKKKKKKEIFFLTIFVFFSNTNI